MGGRERPLTQDEMTLFCRQNTASWRTRERDAGPGLTQDGAEVCSEVSLTTPALKPAVLLEALRLYSALTPDLPRSALWEVT